MTGAWQFVLYLHLLAMAFFVGGQLVVAAAVVPVEASQPEPERMRAIARRFGVGSAIALLVLLVTGMAMASHLDLWDSGTLQLKFALIVVLIGLTVVHLNHPKAHALQAAIFLISLVIVWLGVDLAT